MASFDVLILALLWSRWARIIVRLPPVAKCIRHWPTRYVLDPMSSAIIRNFRCEGAVEGR